jgi:ATP synthase protein I
MAAGDKPPSLDELDARVKAAQQAQESRVGKPGGGPRGGTEKIGVGLRIGIELVAGVVVGTVLGLVLDRWLGTKPWLLIAGFLLGSCAGFLNVYRVAQAEEARRKAAAEVKDQSRSS